MARDEAKDDEGTDEGKEASKAEASRRGSGSSSDDDDEDMSAEEREEMEQMTKQVVHLQRAIRARKARRKILEMVRTRYELCWDPDNKVYFYFNKVTGASRWDPPPLMGRLSTSMATYPIDDNAQRQALKIQCAVRCRQARVRVKKMVKLVYSREYDAKTGDFYYFNNRTGQTMWDKPAAKLLGDFGPDAKQPPRPPGSSSALALVGESGGGDGDGDGDGELGPPPPVPPEGDSSDDSEDDDDILGIEKAHDFSLGKEAQTLYEKDQEIKRLKREIEATRGDVDRIRTSTYQDLKREERMVRLTRMLDGKKRHKDLDLWEPEHVAAWFLELDIDDNYAQNVLDAKVDGKLLIALEEREYNDLGITNRVHLKKVEIMLRKYKQRYERKKAKMAAGTYNKDASDSESGSDSDDDLALPSELIDDDDDLDDDAAAAEAAAAQIVDVDDDLPSEEEQLAMAEDRKNIEVDVLNHGDGDWFPSVGDVVRCHYSIYLPPEGPHGKETMIESSRKKRHRPFEFVVGIGQVIKGWDRGVLNMSYGERSRLTITPGYAYGDKGLPPLIPANSSVIADVELIKWTQRPQWVKPLVQPPGLSMRPYTKGRAGTYRQGDSGRVK